jgi:hypothetical protein
MKVLPFYDPLFVDDAHLSDPDTVLEGYPMLWHVDRVTHQVTASDITVGEDGMLFFGPSTQNFVAYDSLNVSIGQAPLSSVHVEADASWQLTQDTTQIVGGGGGNAITLMDNVKLSSTTDGLAASLPRAGALIGNGWQAGPGTLVEAPGEASFTGTESWSYTNEAKEHNDGDVMSVNGSWTKVFITPAGYLAGVYPGQIRRRIVIGDPETGTPASGSVQYENVYAVGHVLVYTLEVQPADNSGGSSNTQTTNINVQEKVVFDLVADLQPVLFSNDDPSVTTETISYSGLQICNVAPTSRSSYFPTSRGIQSIEHMVAVARAHLLNRARCVNISWQSTWESGLGLSCRHNITIFDDRIPGGVAEGKVIDYSLVGNGDTGDFHTEITIGCTVGNDDAGVLIHAPPSGTYANDTTTVTAGTPDYCDEDYCEDDYQVFIGAVAIGYTGDVGYLVPNDPRSGVLFPNSVFHPGIDVTVTTSSGTQSLIGSYQKSFGSLSSAPKISQMSPPSTASLTNAGAISGSLVDQDGIADAIASSASNLQSNLQSQATILGITLPNIANPAPSGTDCGSSSDSIGSEYDIVLTPLVVPKTIDLSA